MACINPDGSLTDSAQKVLSALKKSSKDTEVASLSNLPVYRVRSSLRELVELGFVDETGDQYSMTKAGETKLQEQE